MTPLALLLVLQAPQPAPAAAGPPSLVSEFQKFCVAHRGDLAAPIAAADAEGGFITVPESMLAQLPAAVTGVQARAKLGGDGAEFVFTGMGDLPSQAGGAPVKANLCFTGAQGADYATVSAAAAAWAALPAYQTTPERTVYAFTEVAGARKPLDPTNAAALAAAVKDRSATVVVVQPIPGGALLGYAVPTP